MKEKEWKISNLRSGDALPGIVLAVGVIYVVIGLSVLKCGSSTVLATGAMLLGTIDVVLGIEYKQIMKHVEDAIAAMIPAMLILLSVGAMVGSWIASGTIPYLMYIGLRILKPSVFLPLVCLLCTVMSVVAGTSWGTMATIGVAAMTVAEGLGVPGYFTAAAVVVGAFFGDSLSPMSDSTVIVCSVTKVPLLKGIRQSLLSTGPAYIVSMVYFAVRGSRLAEHSVSTTVFEEMLHALEEQYLLSPWLLLPLAFVLVLFICKKPVMPVFLCGTAAGAVLSIAVQKNTIAETLTVLTNGGNVQTVSELINKMLSRGGFSSMYSTIGLLIAAAAFSGTLRAADVTEMVGSIVRKVAHGQRRMQLSVLVVHGLCFMITGAYYVSYPLIGTTCRDLFDEYKVDRTVLSRILLDTGTSLAPLIGWSTTGAYTAATLGVAATAFGPHAIMCWLTILFSAALILAGVGVEEKRKADDAK